MALSAIQLIEEYGEQQVLEIYARVRTACNDCSAVDAHRHALDVTNEVLSIRARRVLRAVLVV